MNWTGWLTGVLLSSMNEHTFWSSYFWISPSEKYSFRSFRGCSVLLLSLREWNGRCAISKLPGHYHHVVGALEKTRITECDSSIHDFRENVSEVFKLGLTSADPTLLTWPTANYSLDGFFLRFGGHLSKLARRNNKYLACSKSRLLASSSVV